MAEISEIHELLENVRVTLASTMNPDREHLDELHGSLDAEIKIANKRLRECDALLAEGHRSEAIQLAEQEPNLLEVVSILDFPELPEWNDFVAELGLTVTPELQIDIATDINDAYSEDAPLERLLRKFRVLSLARSPLRARIDILRQIAKRDGATPYWKEDLKEYEEVRVRQIGDEARDAINGQDFDTVRKLADELHNKSWLVKPDRRVVERIDQTMSKLKRMDALKKLVTVTKQVLQAKEDGDPEQTQDLLDKWEQVAQKCDRGVPQFEEAEDSLAPVHRWLRQLAEKEEDKKLFDGEVKKLTKVLRSQQATLEDIYRQYDRVVEFEDFDMPEAVQERYEARIVDIEKQQQTKKMMVMVGVGIGVLVILGIAYALLF